MSEQWKPVIGYEGRYDVSSYGNVKSLKRQGANERILKQQIHNHGYKRVALYKDNIPLDKLVHRLVLEAFISPCPHSMETYHIDSNKLNNRLENLRWDTSKANSDEAIRRGTLQRNKDNLGRFKRSN